MKTQKLSFMSIINHNAEPTDMNGETLAPFECRILKI